MLGSEYTQTPSAALLIAAHPDDEVLGAAGWAWHYPGRLSVAFFTAGVPRDRNCFAPGFDDPKVYGATRRAEADAVWRSHPCAPLLHFGPFSDQGLYQQLDAAGDWLRRLLASDRPSLLVVPAYEGGHPDHDAANLLAAVAMQTARIPVVEYALYHLAGSSIVRQRFAGKSAGRLPPPLAQRKRACFAAYTSQARVLGDFSPELESLRCLPRHDYARPPRDQPALYEHWRWTMSACQVSSALASYAWRRGFPCVS